MKRIILALAVCVAVAAQADYIYWMVDPGAEVTNFIGEESGWTHAILSIQDSGAIYVNQTYPGPGDLGKGGIAELSNDEAVEYADYGAYAAASIGDPSAYNNKYFLIELFSDSNSWIGGYSASASSLAQYIFGDNSMAPIPAAAFGMSGPYAAPEPTSGLLFLVGGMLLGLRRRRQKV